VQIKFHLYNDRVHQYQNLFILFTLLTSFFLLISSELACSPCIEQLQNSRWKRYFSATRIGRALQHCAYALTWWVSNPGYVSL